ncbi:MAG: FAD-dependent oxidoreductase, partial [Pseudomonadota bacterium]
RVCDLIGAARPSIADPYLPKKIEEGRIDAIRECIGCNICVSGELSYSPVRCTQNPTFLEEFRRGWHPENVRPRGSDDALLIVGGGPAGLEAALIAAKRGYDVTLAEARTILGGRVSREASLPGLSEWARVRDWRLHQLRQMANVSLYTSSELSADEILSFQRPRVAIATGALWRKDGIGRFNQTAVPGWDAKHVITPDDVFDGVEVQSPVLIYDEDGTYLGNLLAEQFASDGLDVILATPASEIAPYLALTMEQHKVIPALLDRGVRLERLKQVASIDRAGARMNCVHGGEPMRIDARTIVMLTSRMPQDQLFQDLSSRRSEWSDFQVASVDRLGDCEAPNIIAAAVHAGHRYATELDVNEPQIPGPLPERS